MHALSHLLARFTFVRHLALLLLMLGSITPALAAKTYSDNLDGTVTDPMTGLTWMRCSMGQTWDGTTCTGTASSYSFASANALTSTFAGKSDWRMPNIRELQTIVDVKRFNPSIEWDAFPYTPSSNFWSGSPFVGFSSLAWVVSFSNGVASSYDRSNGYSVRLVRGESFGSLLNIERPSTDYFDHGDGTVTHTPTGLMWKRCAYGQAWTGTTCTGTGSTITADLAADFAGGADWRLPTRDELISLLDYTKKAPAINTTIFPNAPSLDFWSGSPYALDLDFAWVVSFYDGRTGRSLETYSKYSARLVRGGQSFVSVTKYGSGSGTVTSAPAGIDCGTTCSASFNRGTSVTLTAAPASGSTFSGWTGGACNGIVNCTVGISGACSGTGTCTVGIGAEQSVIAFFTALPNTYSLSVTKSGTGSGTITSAPPGVICGTTCSASFNSGTSVTLSATPATGSTFTGWSGACSGTGSCTVSMSAAQSVAASFTATPITYSLSVTKSGTGSGTITSAPTGINCGTTCSASLNSGTSVTLSATPATGSTFTGWGGVCSGTGSCTVSMSAAQNVTATFSNGDLNVPLVLASGWNLIGNSLNQPLQVSPTFSDTSVVNTVWKWNVATMGWQFYTPSMDAAALQTYATSKGYGVLSVISPGEGYWVNAKAASSLANQTGPKYNLTASNLVQGWNLVATGNNVTPSAFNKSLSETPPSPGTVPINLTTLWAWDNTLSQWYFYAPSLEANSTLASYISTKGYLDFTQSSKSLGNGTGFWVNKP